MAERPVSDGPEGIDAPPPVPARGNLAPIALGLGIPGLLLGLVPFYGSFLALPLSVVAVVLGLTARGRPEEHRGQATGGLVTGGLGLLLVIGWVGLFAWNQSGLGTFASETSVQVQSGSSSAVAVPEPRATPQQDAPDDPDGPVTVGPGGQHGAVRTGLSGSAEGTLGDRDLAMELSDCTLSRTGSRGLLVRGDGPDGRLVVTQVGDYSGGVVVAVESTDGPSGTWTGTQRGLSGSSSGGLLTERHRFTLEGQLRDLHDDQEVTVELVVTCD